MKWGGCVARVARAGLETATIAHRATRPPRLGEALYDLHAPRGVDVLALNARQSPAHRGTLRGS